MQDIEFKQLLLANLEKIESKQDTLNAKVEEIRLNLALQGKDLESIKVDLPEIKEDLRLHKEGNIQNRTRIAHIEQLNLDQDALINKTLSIYQQEVKPVVDHVIWMQSMPAKIVKWAVGVSKVLAALVAIAASAGTLYAYLSGFMK